MYFKSKSAKSLMLIHDCFFAGAQESESRPRDPSERANFNMHDAKRRIVKII